MILFKVTRLAGCRQTLFCGAKATAAQHLKMQVDEKNIIQKDMYPNVHACSAAQSVLTLCDPMDREAQWATVREDSPGKNTGVCCHALLQGIFTTQRSNPGLPHCRQILY